MRRSRRAATLPLVTVTGGLTLNGSLIGVGTVTGNVINGGQVSPGGVGKAGVLNITGNYTQNAGGILNIDLGGTTAGTQFDQLAVTGVASLAGTLNVGPINGFSPSNGNSFKVLTFGSVSGSFTTQNLQISPTL